MEKYRHRVSSNSYRSIEYCSDYIYFILQPVLDSVTSFRYNIQMEFLNHNCGSVRAEKNPYQY